MTNNRHDNSTRTLVLQRVAFFAALLLVWYVCYPHTLLHLEETDYWTDAPDMVRTIYLLPAAWADWTGSFLMQFFQDRLAGAALMAAMPTVVLLCADVVLWHLLRRADWLWLSLLPAIAVVLFAQTAQDTLVPSLRWAVVSVVVALAVWLASLFMRHRPSQKRLSLVGKLLPYVLVLLVVVVLVASPNRRQTEQTNRIEHLAATQQWGQLLDETYPNRHQLDDNLMSYSLLALSQQGQLADRLFTYPVRGLENVFTSAENYRFNAFFCHELGLPNEAIRYTFQEGQYMPAGASFGTIRRMVDWLIEKGDDPQLADYYLRLLDHTSCHRRFMASRRARMGQTPDEQPLHELQPEFVGSPSFLHEAAVVLDADPTNEQARDYLLCGLLLLGNTDAFAQLFDQLYVQMDDLPLPTHYAEALAALRHQHPQVASTWQLGSDVVHAYQDFLAMLRQPVNGRQRAEEKYADTYWGYLLRLTDGQQTDKRPAPTVDVVTSASQLLGPTFGD